MVQAQVAVRVAGNAAPRPILDERRRRSSSASVSAFSLSKTQA